MDLCKDGMFWCAFELVFGIGAGVIALIVVAAFLGLFDNLEFKEKK